MSDFITTSSFFGMALTFLVYYFFHIVKEKLKIKSPLFNPLLLSATVIICLLLVTKTDYEVYNQGAKYLTYWLTPLTICLAVPLYRRVKELKENFFAIIISVFAGVIGHAVIIGAITIAFNVNRVLAHSIMPKSVTTVVALGLCNKLGGIESVTIVGVTIAGMTGVIVGPIILKALKITEPAAQGLAFGTASHALGTSKAMEYGEVQGAMSSLALVVTAILTVIVVPFLAIITG